MTAVSHSKKKINIHVGILVSSVGFSRKGGSQVEVRLIFSPACGKSVILDQIQWHTFCYFVQMILKHKHYSYNRFFN